MNVVSEITKVVGFVPLGDRVAILPGEEPDKIGSLHVPESAKKRPTTGVIVGVGEKCEDVGNVYVGAVVLYGKYAGTPYEHEGVEYVLLKEEDLLARIQEA